MGMQRQTGSAPKARSLPRAVTSPPVAPQGDAKPAVTGESQPTEKQIAE